MSLGEERENATFDFSREKKWRINQKGFWVCVTRLCEIKNWILDHRRHLVLGNSRIVLELKNTVDKGPWFTQRSEGG